MAQESKNFLVSTADVAFYHNGMLAFTGTTSLTTSISVSMEDQEVTGGKGNKTLYKFKYGRKLAPSIEMAEWNLSYIAANLGQTIFTGLKDVFKINECVSLTSGVGTLAKTPVGKVHVVKADGVIVEVTPVGSTITVGTDTENVKVTYQYSTTVDRVVVDAESTPLVGKLVMTADKHNNLRGKVGEVQIEVPSFQLSGTFDISLEASGTTTTKLDGDALAVTGATCSDGDVYAYITEINDGDSSVAVEDICATPSVLSMAVNDTQQIKVIGIRSGLYSNVEIDADDCTIVSDTTAKVTVTAGVIKAVAIGTAIVTVTYNGKSDVIKVTVA